MISLLAMRKKVASHLSKNIHISSRSNLPQTDITHSRHSTIITIDKSLRNTHIRISSCGEPNEIASQHSTEANLIAQISDHEKQAQDFASQLEYLRQHNLMLKKDLRSQINDEVLKLYHDKKYSYAAKCCYYAAIRT